MPGRVEIIRIEAPEYVKAGEWVYVTVTATNWGDDDYCSIWIFTEPNIGWTKEGKMLRESNSTWRKGLNTTMGAFDVTFRAKAGHWVGDVFVVDDEKTVLVKLSTAKLEITEVGVT